MDKLIYKETNGDLTCRARDFDKIFETLYAYESTNLIPERIDAMKIQNLNLATMVLEMKTNLEKAHDVQKDLQATITNLLDTLRELAPCPSCKHRKKPGNESPCDECNFDSNWEWAGEKEM